MIIVVMGPPAAGKGTQCKLIAEHLGLPHISTGALLREALASGESLGAVARPFLDRGELIPDDAMSAIVKERLHEPDTSQGAILDGFPRTVDQARKLGEVLTGMGRRIDAVIYLRVPLEVVLERVSHRFSCPRCGATYTRQSTSTAASTTCDNCGATLLQRPDDHPDVVRRRLEVYEAQTAPLIDFYRAQNVMIEVDGAQPVERVFESELAGLDELALTGTPGVRNPKTPG